MSILKTSQKNLKAFFLSPMFGRFVAIGFINGFNGIAFSYIFSFVLPVNISFIIGYSISICISYFLNSYFVFKRKFTVERFFKFCISYIPNFIIQNICVLIMYNWLCWHEIVAFTLAAFIAVPVTYVILTLVTFKNVKQ